MLDLGLLHSFVSVVDAGGFTRASSRVHRTQSTISQQVMRLEKQVGQTLLKREGRNVTLTEDGERLLSYARRILALESEARDAVRHDNQGIIRLGVTEDFAERYLTSLLVDVARARPRIRLDIHCAFSSALRQDLEQGQIDLALVKRDVAEGGAIASWSERLVWVVGSAFQGDVRRDPLPLVVFGPACLYHNRSLHALESMGRSWQIAFSSPNTPGVQAAVSAGLGIAIVPEAAVLKDHRVLGQKEGFPIVTDTELALLMTPEARFAVREAADLVSQFCTAVTARSAPAEWNRRIRSPRRETG